MAQGRWILLLGLVGLCGCAHDYLMKLNNGDQILSLSKPTPYGTNYVYTGSAGTKYVIAQSRVVSVRSVSVVKQEQKRPTPASPPRPKQTKHWYFLWLA